MSGSAAGQCFSVLLLWSAPQESVSNRGIGLTHELARPPGVLTEYSPVIHDGVLQGDRRMKIFKPTLAIKVFNWLLTLSPQDTNPSLPKQLIFFTMKR